MAINMQYVEGIKQEFRRLSHDEQEKRIKYIKGILKKIDTGTYSCAIDGIDNRLRFWFEEYRYFINNR